MINLYGRSVLLFYGTLNRRINELENYVFSYNTTSKTRSPVRTSTDYEGCYTTSSLSASVPTFFDSSLVWIVSLGYMLCGCRGSFPRSYGIILILVGTITIGPALLHTSPPRETLVSQFESTGGRDKEIVIEGRLTH